MICGTAHPGGRTVDTHRRLLEARLRSSGLSARAAVGRRRKDVWEYAFSAMRGVGGATCARVPAGQRQPGKCSGNIDERVAQERRPGTHRCTVSVRRASDAASAKDRAKAFHPRP